MAIMWEPPADRVSLEPTPAELAWRRWLMEALVAKEDEAPTPGSPEAGTEQAESAA